MNYLVFNGGSFSLKWRLYDESLNEIDRGYEEKDYNVGKILEKHKGEVGRIGHRVVHGGWKYFKPTKVDRDVLDYLGKVSNLAPLHNKQELEIIKSCQKKLPEIENIAVFDTGFFENLPEISKRYGIKKELNDKYKLRRFGFHGISHEYVIERAACELGKGVDSINLISIHLGAGCSIVAIGKGKAIDCSFGFTPMEGLLMGRRCGDIDCGIIFYLINQKGVESEDLEKILTYESGVLGICGKNDMREVVEKADKDDGCRLALEMFIYRIRKYIGAYYAVLEGKVDGIVLTGAIGFKCEICKKMIFDGFDWMLGNTRVLPIETNEELAIARKLKKF